MKGTAKPQNDRIAWMNMIPEWEEGDQIWLRTVIGKTTVAQQLAEKATEKKKKTWQELVPERYHNFGDVFSEAASERFPERRHWDHAIDLKTDAPTSIDCHVYPLSPKEKEEQKEFLKSNLQLHRIQHSNTPYCMPVASSSSERKMVNSIQSRTIAALTNGPCQTSTHSRSSRNLSTT